MADPILRCAFQPTGSPHWLMQTIRQQGLDGRHGFRLQIDYHTDRLRPPAAQRGSNPQHATPTAWYPAEQALLDAKVDVIDADWLRLRAMRHAGHALQAVAPYGLILGALIAPANSPVRQLSDLPGQRVAMVSRQDKNWRLTCAYADQHRTELTAQGGLDRQVTALELGSNMAICAQMDSGGFDAALVQWPQLPALLASGARLLLDIAQVPRALGADLSATSFFVMREDTIAANPARVNGFIEACRDAADLLRSNEALWRRLILHSNRDTDPQTLTPLRQAWMARISTDFAQSDLSALARLEQRLAPPLADGPLAPLDELFAAPYFTPETPPCTRSSPALET